VILKTAAFSAANHMAKTQTKKSTKPTGYILHQTDNFVVIVTGVSRKSNNPKTGNMLQVWILNRHESPLDSLKSGSDVNVCFNCPLRGVAGKERVCYVDLGKAPTMIWRKYQRGGYAFLPISGYTEVFSGRAVRFGAYGEPVLIPLPVMAEITSLARKWTGYTHQWRQPEFQAYRPLLMASCDAPGDYALAHAMDWRTFRGRAADSPLLPGEITCPASDEGGHRSSCERCGLCNGATPGDARKSIGIIVHGIGSKNFVKLGEIQPLARLA